MSTEKEVAKLLKSPVGFLESKYGYYVPELKKPIKFLSWERCLISKILESDKPIRVIGDIKKNLKTTKAAAICYYEALKYPNSEIYIVANDFEQSKSRVFTYLAKSCEINPYIQPNITTNQIIFSNGTTIKALPSDFKGEAGANPRLSCFDEPWGFVEEAKIRMLEEFTVPPNIPDAFQLFTGYAGFEQESIFWHDLYKRGVKGEPIDSDIPLYETDEILFYWSHGPLNDHPGQPWHTKEYFKQQKKIVRPFQFQRLHNNKWVKNEDRFLSEEQYEDCLNLNHSPPLPNSEIYLYVGVDASVKRDCSAIVSVYVEGRKIKLGPLQIFHPTPDQPMNLEASVGGYLSWLKENYRIIVIRYDPYQLHAVMTNLESEGYPAEEFNQTSGNLTAMGSNLFDLFQHNNIELYSHDDMKQHLLNAVAKETSRGYKIEKEKARLKIDGAVALAMACLPAVEDMNREETDLNDFYDLPKHRHTKSETAGIMDIEF